METNLTLNFTKASGGEIVRYSFVVLVLSNCYYMIEVCLFRWICRGVISVNLYLDYK